VSFPTATIGILGGGQLGRMLALAAARLGHACAVYDPDPACPAGQVARATTGAWDDADALAAFSRTVDIVTFEFENIPLPALAAIEAPVRPGPRSLAVSQDRLVEKEFLAALGLAVAPFARVEGQGDLAAAHARLGDGILKTRRLGYDGKGQVRLPAPDPLAAIGHAPAILEGFVPFRREVSAIVARGLDGATIAFDPGENVHKDGILDTTTVPAAISSFRAEEAQVIAARVAEALGHVGVLAVEFFETDAGLVVNEIAPRVHNSGHWTQDGCLVDQFEAHIRAIAGWPMGDGSRHSDVTMTNLIGRDIDAAADWAARPACHVHLYGKAETWGGRTLGHVNRLTGPAPVPSG
jgi:5-(carboxyamino)imidazole ribonucleotide synthase